MLKCLLCTVGALCPWVWHLLIWSNPNSGTWWRASHNLLDEITLGNILRHKQAACSIPAPQKTFRSLLEGTFGLAKNWKGLSESSSRPSKGPGGYTQSLLVPGSLLELSDRHFWLFCFLWKLVFEASRSGSPMNIHCKSVIQPKYSI